MLDNEAPVIPGTGTPVTIAPRTPQFGTLSPGFGFCGPRGSNCKTSIIPPAELERLQMLDNEPTLGQQTTTAVSPEPTGPVTSDGTCGANNNNSICGNWHLGSCCSMYGFCGNLTGHCGDGCQSGPCYQSPTIPVPGPSSAPVNARPGSFKAVGDSGVPAMHAALMPNGRVVFLDKVENYTHLKLSDGYYAYSSEYDPATNLAVPLAYKTNAFCAGGAFLENGTLLAVGGNGNLSWLDPTVTDGWRGLRYLTRSAVDGSFNGQDWSEPGNQLNTARWYPSVQTMPDGTIFVASGSLNGLDPAQNANNNPTYEILDKNGVTQGQSIPMDILVTAQPYYMYPFLHLLPDGSLFVFTSKSSGIFDVSSNSTTKSFSDLPGDYRTYPNTGGSVMLPLSSENNWSPEILICGGGAYQDITSPTDSSCGRIQPLSSDAEPDWEMDSMPQGRTMVEATLLPDGTVLWLNGANIGAQGFGLATSPTMEALLYDPSAKLGERWTTGANSTIPRLYHSVALLLLDGTVMIAGSNPVQMPVLEASQANPFVTEFRVEIYTPGYLADESRRPGDVGLSTLSLVADGAKFEVTFTAPDDAKELKIALYHGGFVTHSLHMGHRMLFLDNEGFKAGQAKQKIEVTMPPNSSLAPPGPYVVYVVVDGVPGIGQFVMVSAASSGQEVKGESERVGNSTIKVWSIASLVSLVSRWL